MNTFKTPHFFLLVILLTGVFSCSNESTTTPQIIIEPLPASQQLNVSYGNHPRQVYDLYLPENRTLDTKVLILIHGGGWTSGSKETMNPFKDFLRGDLPDVAVVNINYRLATPDNPPFPMQIDDITAMVNHLKTNQNEYQISDQFGFIGVSAGAHLSMLWSYANDFDNNVNMVCSIVGPTVKIQFY